MRRVLMDRPPIMNESNSFQYSIMWVNVKHSINPVVHNVRPAGHIRPATSPHVARGVQPEKWLF